MSKLIDLIGQKFGKLTVIKYVGRNKHGQPRWLCKCDCEQETIVLSYSFKSGHTKKGSTKE